MIALVSSLLGLGPTLMHRTVYNFRPFDDRSINFLSILLFIDFSFHRQLNFGLKLNRACVMNLRNMGAGDK